MEEEKKEVSEVKEKCPLCGANMVIRKGPYGRFLGCSSYPHCKGMKKLV